MTLLIDVPTIKIEPIIPPLTIHDNGTIRIGQTRILLSSVMVAYEQGDSPKMIQEGYPSLTLEEVCATITWMLQNREFMTAYKADVEAQWAELRFLRSGTFSAFTTACGLSI